jgi:hypothetical protein
VHAGGGGDGGGGAGGGGEGGGGEGGSWPQQSSWYDPVPDPSSALAVESVRGFHNTVRDPDSVVASTQPYGKSVVDPSQVAGPAEAGGSSSGASARQSATVWIRPSPRSAHVTPTGSGSASA